jgi:predicted phage terminase large subunit-like protein
MIFAPPRHSKSELASRRFPAWYLGKFPDRQLITASYGDVLASDIGADVRGIIRDPYYRHIFPNTNLRVDTKAAGRWRTEQGGIYIATGIGGPIVGRGAHLAIIDDPIKNREEADSQRTRDKVHYWFMSSLLTRLMPGGAIVLMMTRWHEDDLAGRLLATGNNEWTVIKLRALENEDTENEQALWPAWYPLTSLHRIRQTMAEGGRLREWRAQYQQEPTSEEGLYILRKWFDVRQPPPHNVRIYMASDFAVTEAEEGRDPDFTEHGVFAIDDESNIYPIRWWSGRTTADVWIEKLLDLVSHYKPMCWFGEGGVIRRAIEPMLKKRCNERKVFFRQEWVTSSKDKSIRGRAFQARASMGKIIFPAAEEWAEQVIEQCVGFPGARYDDKFDVMSLFCGVIDRAHPAFKHNAPAPTQRVDRYRPYVVNDESNNWKVV